MVFDNLYYSGICIYFWKIIEASHSSVSRISEYNRRFLDGIMLYGFLFLLLSDIISLILRIAGYLTAGTYGFRKWSYILTLFISFMLIAGGSLNALTPM